MSEVKVTASDGSRDITLDPIRVKRLDIPAREVESTIPCGFQQEWVSGQTGEGRDFWLGVGAGLGSRWLTFDYRDRKFCIDVEHIVRALVKFADSTERSEEMKEAIKRNEQIRAAQNGGK